MLVPPMKILILGAAGMLGHTVLRFLSQSPGVDAWGTARRLPNCEAFSDGQKARLLTGIDIENPDQLAGVLDTVRPDVLVNCIGIVKQLEAATDALVSISINSLLPHRLARFAALTDTRVIHVSTDCVFSGARGGYKETDLPDAADLYGRSKLLGEIDYPNAMTLRTSIIGHELGGAHGLLEWFLSQEGSARGFTRAVFSGLPTVELAHVIRDHVLPRPELRGVYHVSASPIAKYDLLELVAREYGRAIDIVPDDHLVIDRSLDSTRFRAATGYVPPSWPELVRKMREFG